MSSVKSLAASSESAPELENTTPANPMSWNSSYLTAIGATLTFGLRFNNDPPPPVELLDAAQATITFRSATFRSYATVFANRYPSAVFRNIRWTVRRLVKTEAWPWQCDEREVYCTKFIEQVLKYLCPQYDRPGYDLELQYHDRLSVWKARGRIGREAWLVVARRRKQDFAEEIGYAISIAQEYNHLYASDDITLWMVTLRGSWAAVMKITILTGMLRSSEELRSLKAGDLISSPGFVRAEVTGEYKLTDDDQRVEFVTVLHGLSLVINTMEAQAWTLTAPMSWQPAFF